MYIGVEVEIEIELQTSKCVFVYFKLQNPNFTPEHSNFKLQHSNFKIQLFKFKIAVIFNFEVKLNFASTKKLDVQIGPPEH